MARRGHSSASQGARGGAGSSASSSSSASSQQYCLDLVKKHDFDSYVAGLLLPAAARNSYFAIRSFNAEIAMIRDNTHGNAMAGRIRFQWWRDLLQEIYHGQHGGASMVATSPVAQALSEAVHKHDLSERWFERSLDARQRDLAGEQVRGYTLWAGGALCFLCSVCVFSLSPARPFSHLFTPSLPLPLPPGYYEQPDTLDALENYAEEGHSSVQYLVLQSLGVQDEASEYAASHVGVASGLTTTLRGFAYHASQVRVCVCVCVRVCPRPRPRPSTRVPHVPPWSLS